MFQRSCQWCHEGFVSKRSSATYCSPGCRQRAHRAAHNDQSAGRLPFMLHEVAEDIAAGRARHTQVSRLIKMLYRYQLDHLEREVEKSDPARPRRKASQGHKPPA